LKWFHFSQQLSRVGVTRKEYTCLLRI
jgi:hypothetical protein